MVMHVCCMCLSTGPGATPRVGTPGYRRLSSLTIVAICAQPPVGVASTPSLPDAV